MAKNLLNQNSASFSFYILILYAISVLYIIPYEAIPHTKIFLPIISLIFFFELIFNRQKLNKLDLFFIPLLLSTSALNFSLSRFADAIYLSVLLLVCRRFQSLNRYFLLFIYTSSFLGIVYQLANYQDEENNNPVLSNLDPNFSGFFLLLFFLFCYKNNYKIGMILSLICISFFVSRAYILALIVFLIVLFFEKFYKKVNYFIVKRFPFILLLFLANIIVLIIGYYFLNYLDNIIEINDARQISRIVQYNDNSNYSRFLAIFKMFAVMSNRPNITLFGLQDDSTEAMKAILQSSVVHNEFFSIIFIRGLIFSLIYFLILDRIINKLYKAENLKYVLPVGFYSLFLHTGFQGVELVFFITILALPEYQKKVRSHTSNINYHSSALMSNQSVDN